MKKTIKNGIVGVGIVFVVSGCSVTPQHKEPVIVTKPVEVPVPKVVKPKPPVAKVERYTGTERVAVHEISDRATSFETEAEAARENEKLNPYKKVPDQAGQEGGAVARKEVNKSGGGAKSSPAVRLLLVQSGVDLVAGRVASAEEKVERAIRIDPENPQAWYKLAEINQHKKNYAQAITLAKKSMSFAEGDADLHRQNWRLIADVSRESGDVEGMKEAIRNQSLIQ